MSDHFETAILLIEQKRFELAIRELQQDLLEDPETSRTHALLAVCLNQLGRSKEALKAAQQAIALAPDDAYGHYVLSGVYIELEQYARAEQAINEALRLDPEDADYHNRLGSIQLQQRQWKKALHSAEYALQINAENVDALNLRAIALDHLNQKDAAHAAAADVLQINPEDPTGHASRGWQALRHGNTDMAMPHFREALRLDSNLTWAREGLVETLKAQNPMYRVMLSYFLWLGRLEPKALWGFLIGGYLLSKVLIEFAKSNPSWAPYIWTVLFIYLAFCLMTWISQPLFNLLLRWHPLGRLALSRQQTRAANWFGGCLLLALLSALLWLALHMRPFLILAIISGVMVIPLTNALGATSPRARKILLAYTGLLGTLGALTIAGSFFEQIEWAFALPAILFFLAMVIFVWMANIVHARY